MDGNPERPVEGGSEAAEPQEDAAQYTVDKTNSVCVCNV